MRLVVVLQPLPAMLPGESLDEQQEAQLDAELAQLRNGVQQVTYTAQPGTTRYSTWLNYMAGHVHVSLAHSCTCSWLSSQLLALPYIIGRCARTAAVQLHALDTAVQLHGKHDSRVLAFASTFNGHVSL